MKFNLKVFIELFSIVLPGLANAACVTDVKLNGVQALGDGTFILYAPNNTSSICSEGGKLFHVKVNQNGVTESGLKLIVSTAMSAYSMNKNISIWYDDSVSHCWVHSVVVKE